MFVFVKVISSERLRPEERICKYCSLDEVEDEQHFLLKCPLYNSERTVLLHALGSVYNSVEDWSYTEKFQTIVSSNKLDLMLALGRFLTDCFSIRNTTTTL